MLDPGETLFGGDGDNAAANQQAGGGIVAGVDAEDVDGRRSV